MHTTGNKECVIPEGIQTGRYGVYLYLSENDKNISSDLILKVLEKKKSKRLVIKGYEPLAQQRELIYFLDKLKKWKIEIETNGTIMPDVLIRDQVDYWCVVPKETEQTDPMLFFTQNKKSYFKFYIGKKEDVQNMMELISLFGIPTEKIMLAGKGKTLTEYKLSMEIMIQLAKEFDFTISPDMRFLMPEG